MAKEEYDEDDLEDEDLEEDEEDLEEDEEDLEEDEEEKPKKGKSKSKTSSKKKENQLNGWQPYIRNASYGVVNPKTKEFIGGNTLEEANLVILSRILTAAEEAAKNTR